MKVVDHQRVSNQLAKKARRAKLKKIVPVILLLLVAGGFALYFFVIKDDKQPSRDTSQTQPETQTTASETGPKSLKTFTPEEFMQLYSSFSYPYTEQIETPPEITGDPDADAHIRTLAEARGYALRSLPVANRLEPVSDEFSLQSLAVQPLKDLLDEAAKAGLALSVSSGFRSVDDQQTLFSERLAAAGVGIANVYFISSGQADAAINQVLDTTAPPGYSRHHTGYTVDLQCGSSGLSAFQFSDCATWLAKDNYAAAKTLGWIPSYPDGAKLQGPEPEAWEYIWVGPDALYE